MIEAKTKELTYAQRIILWSCSQKAKTKSEIREQLGITESCIVSNLRKLREAGFVYICGSKSTTGRRAPVYATHSHHEEPPKTLGGETTKTTRTRAIVAEALKQGQMTSQEIAEFTGLRVSQVRGCIMSWRHGENGSKYFRVSGWQLIEGYGPVAMYSVGPGQDVRRPVITRQQREVVWREKNRARIREQRRLWDAKRAGRSEPVLSGPFTQLLTFTGAAASASKRTRDEEKKAMVPA